MKGDEDFDVDADAVSGGKIAKGAAWMVSAKLVMKAISFISTIVLARLLVPDDFGLVAIAMSVVSFVDLIRYFGFSTALVNDPKATRLHYDTAWTLSFIFSMGAALLMLLLSHRMADFYGDPRLANVLMCMSLYFAMDGIYNIGVVDFQKYMRFEREFILFVSVKVVGFVVSVSMAVALGNYWALLGGTLVSKFASVILSYTMHSYRPRLALGAWRQLLGFSSWLMLNNILTFTNKDGTRLVMGKFLGTSDLGIITISGELASLTAVTLIAPINRAAYPVYAKVSGNLQKLRQEYFNVNAHICVIAIPGALGIGALAPLLVPVVLGPQWSVAVVYMQLMAIGAAFTALTTNNLYVYLVLKKQYVTTGLLALRIVIMLPLMLYFIDRAGALGAVQALVISTIIMFPIRELVLVRVLRNRWRDSLAGYLRPALSGMLMYLVVSYYCQWVGAQQLSPAGVAYLIGGVLLGAFVYTAILCLIWLVEGRPKGAVSEILEVITGRLQRLLSRVGVK